MNEVFNFICVYVCFWALHANNMIFFFKKSILFLFYLYLIFINLDLKGEMRYDAFTIKHLFLTTQTQKEAFLNDLLN